MRNGLGARSLTVQLLENVVLSLLAAGFSFVASFLALTGARLLLARLGYDRLPEEAVLRYGMIGVCGTVAFVFFCVCYTALIHRKLRYIQMLKEELDAMAGGELERPVPVLGYDELSELAAGMDEMRRSFLAHLREEDQIRSANSQLVTAMSHDLRTPLTSLMAYLELLDRHKYTDEEQMRHLIRQSLVQSRAIKSMTDKLFEYFLVYATEWEQPVMETMDADDLIGPIWREYAFTLESEGFRVQLEEGPLQGRVSVNLPLLRRAFDNMYSTLLKYADPARLVVISCRRSGDEMALDVKNGVSPQRDRKESSNIGLNTCRRVFRLHNGSFDTVEEDGVFFARMTLPLL